MFDDPDSYFSKSCVPQLAVFPALVAVIFALCKGERQGVVGSLEIYTQGQVEVYHVYL